jgi:hypothetical protein
MALRLHLAVPAIVGFTMLGLGLGAIVPICLRAGGSQPGIPSGFGIAAVSTMGYAGLLTGPPIIGTVAGVVGLRAALAMVVGLLVVLAADRRARRGRASRSPSRPSRRSCSRPAGSRSTGRLHPPVHPVGPDVEVRALGSRSTTGRADLRAMVVAVVERLSEEQVRGVRQLRPRSASRQRDVELGCAGSTMRHLTAWSRRASASSSSVRTGSVPVFGGGGVPSR